MYKHSSLVNRVLFSFILLSLCLLEACGKNNASVCSIGDSYEYTTRENIKLVCIIPIQPEIIFIKKIYESQPYDNVVKNNDFLNYVCDSDYDALNDVTCENSFVCDIHLNNAEEKQLYVICIKDYLAGPLITAIPFLIKDTTPPRVSYTNPADNEYDVDTDAKLYIYFDEQINVASINDDAVQIECNDRIFNDLDKIVQYEDSTQGVVLNFLLKLPYDARCSVNVNSNIEDLAGNRMSSTYGFIFYTESSLGNWIPITEHAGFSARDSAEGVIFHDSMWLSNGYYHGDVLIRDLWRSEDGYIWTLVSENTPYDGYSEIVAYNDKLWAVKKSVWMSIDGYNWQLVLDETPFGDRPHGEVVVFNGKMWQLGSGADVWYSTDGNNWQLATDNAPYGGRKYTGVVVFNGNICLLGGATYEVNDPIENGYPYMTTYNDMWCSGDGIVWNEVIDHAPWSPRMWFCAEIYRDALWIIGGYDNVNNQNLNNVWFTRDGINWLKYETKDIFDARHESACYVFDDSLWVVAGNTWPVVNDVWRLTAK